MIVTIDLDQLTELARLEALAHEPRTPGRRAAATLYVALTETRTIDAARRALSGFTASDVEADALDLMHRLAAEVTRDVLAGNPAREAAPPNGEHVDKHEPHQRPAELPR